MDSDVFQIFIMVALSVIALTLIGCLALEVYLTVQRKRSDKIQDEQYKKVLKYLETITKNTYKISDFPKKDSPIKSSSKDDSRKMESPKMESPKKESPKPKMLDAAALIDNSAIVNGGPRDLKWKNSPSNSPNRNGTAKIIHSTPSRKTEGLTECLNGDLPFNPEQTVPKRLESDALSLIAQNGDRENGFKFVHQPRSFQHDQMKYRLFSRNSGVIQFDRSSIHDRVHLDVKNKVVGTNYAFIKPTNHDFPEIVSDQLARNPYIGCLNDTGIDTDGMESASPFNSASDKSSSPQSIIMKNHKSHHKSKQIEKLTTTKMVTTTTRTCTTAAHLNGNHVNIEMHDYSPPLTQSYLNSPHNTSLGDTDGSLSIEDGINGNQDSHRELSLPPVSTIFSGDHQAALKSLDDVIDDSFDRLFYVVDPHREDAIKRQKLEISKNECKSEAKVLKVHFKD